MRLRQNGRTISAVHGPIPRIAPRVLIAFSSFIIDISYSSFVQSRNLSAIPRMYSVLRTLSKYRQRFLSRIRYIRGTWHIAEHFPEIGPDAFVHGDGNLLTDDVSDNGGKHVGIEGQRRGPTIPIILAGFSSLEQRYSVDSLPYSK